MAVGRSCRKKVFEFHLRHLRHLRTLSISEERDTQRKLHPRRSDGERHFVFHLRDLRHLRTYCISVEVVQRKLHYLVDMEKRDPQTYAIIGAAMEVHSQLGPGFLESVYQEALAREFSLRKIPFEENVELPVYYKGERLNAFFRADFICFGDVVVELKALRQLSGTEEAQILNYLKATGIERGVLLNFGEPQLRYERRILSRVNV